MCKILYEGRRKAASEKTALPLSVKCWLNKSQPWDNTMHTAEPWWDSTWTWGPALHVTLERIIGLRVGVNKDEEAGNYLQEMAWNSWQSTNKPNAQFTIEGITVCPETSVLGGEWNRMWVTFIERKRGKQAGKCLKKMITSFLLRACATYDWIS